MPFALSKIILFIIVFATGGLLCAVAQLLIVRTRLTPARILVLFLIVGIVLEAVGVFDAIHNVARAGIAVPIVGFGASLARGSIQGARNAGLMGAFSGGLTATAMGIGVAIIASFLVTLVFRPKTK